MPSLTPLLLLPGLMNDERVWENQRAALAAAGRPVVVATTYGHDTVAALAEQAIAAMPAGPFAVAGFSLGGHVAFEVMRQAPDRVAGAALLATGARADSPESRQGRQRMIDGIAGGGNLAAVATAFLPRVLHPSRVGDARLTELLVSMAATVGAEGFVRQQRAAMGRPESLGTLERFTAPALVVGGDDDQVAPPELSREMAAKLPGAELVLVPDCGHMLTLEHPQAVNAAMQRWLTRVDAHGLAT